ncbi:MAG TPA: DMT family transporter [Xanthobacteraceae bacterium]|jgi:drug/metabolite transporter (DMT)-like permease|nr:DMT family transporter [Xanthobacteraceae bacterium]
MSDAVKARLLLVTLCLAWGLTWPAMRIALYDIPPFTMRTLSALIGAASMLVLATLARRPVQLPKASLWPFIVIVSFCNIIAFSVCVAFAQLIATTGRVAILVYTMPIWASLLAMFVLRERLTPVRAIALILCCVGMGVLIYPVALHGVPLGLVLALCAAVFWAIGTVYIKWYRAEIDPFTLSAWQLIVACVAMLVLLLTFEGLIDFSSIGWKSWAGVIFSGFFGSAVAYYLWFEIIRLLPMTTASLGALASPVIGVVSSVFLLHEWPTAWDIVGFVIIFSASVCVLLEPQLPSFGSKRG